MKEEKTECEKQKRTTEQKGMKVTKKIENEIDKKQNSADLEAQALQVAIPYRNSL